MGAISVWLLQRPVRSLFLIEEHERGSCGHNIGRFHPGNNDTQKPVTCFIF